jgi:hypothetical protein
VDSEPLSLTLHAYVPRCESLLRALWLITVH